MINRLVNKILKSINNLPAEYKVALARILTSIIQGLIALEEKKVDKKEGKDLSSNDFTDELKEKLENLPEEFIQENADWNSNSGPSQILNKPDLTVYPDSAEWSHEDKKIYFKHQGNIINEFTIDGADFVKDGMVNDVKIENDNLVITFNTESGKQPISIPISDIFNANNYYNKSETDDLLNEKQDVLISGDNIKTINNESILGSGNINIDIPYMTEITWSALKYLRDNSKLISGMQYRITDYECTTITNYTQSAGNQFDIIVVADSKNVLNENARACLHEGDTYFANSKLETWKLKYCLDNDTTRFDWADTTNGKGVIYWMKDEWNNECPYDFKNIQYELHKIISTYGDYNSFLNKYMLSNHEFGDIFTLDNTIYWFYTFGIKDFTVEGINVKNNIIKGDTNNIKSLPFNIIVTVYDASIYDNIFDYNTHTNILYTECYRNIISFNSSWNLLCSYSSNNYIEGYKNIFNNTCTHNYIKNCNNIRLLSYCDYNTILNTSNVFMRTNCLYNTIYENCIDIQLSDYCSYNTIYRNCKVIYFYTNYTYNVIIENNNMYFTIQSTQTTSASNRLQNIKIKQRTNNITTLKGIYHDTVNDNFQTIYRATGLQDVEVEI